VEDTYNLLGHAPKKALGVICRQQGRGLAEVAEDIRRDLANQRDAELSEVHIDRAYLSSELVGERPGGLEVYCKAWPVRNATGLYPKSTFELDWGRGSAQNGRHRALEVSKNLAIKHPHR
jgi:hypothetical protein